MPQSPHQGLLAQGLLHVFLNVDTSTSNLWCWRCVAHLYALYSTRIHGLKAEGVGNETPAIVSTNPPGLTGQELGLQDSKQLKKRT